MAFIQGAGQVGSGIEEFLRQFVEIANAQVAGGQPPDANAQALLANRQAEQTALAKAGASLRVPPVVNANPNPLLSALIQPEEIPIDPGVGRDDGSEVEFPKTKKTKETEEEPEKEKRKGPSAEQISKSLKAAGTVVDENKTKATSPPGSPGFPRGGTAIAGDGLGTLMKLLLSGGKDNVGEIPSLSSLIGRG